METEKKEKRQKKVEEENDEDTLTEFYDRMYLAALGAFAMTHEKAKKVIDKLVERGEQAKKENESIINEMHERHMRHIREREEYMHKRVEEFFEQVHGPTKSDLEELSNKITELEKKIDEFAKTKE